MHLPKHSNPHLIVDATQIVSRKALRHQDDGGEDVDRDREADEAGLDIHEVEDLYVKLDKIVSKRLKLKRSLTLSDECDPNKRTKTATGEEGKPPEPQQHPEPVGEFIPSCSP